MKDESIPMKPEDCFELGYIARAHGVHGEVRATFDVTDIRKYRKKESFWLMKFGKMAPFAVDSIHIMSDNEALIAFKEVTSREAAEQLRGSTILLPLNELPKIPKGKFYHHEVEGFTVVDSKLGPLGQVKEVQEMPAQNLVVMMYKGSEVLIPIVKHIVKGIDRDKREMYTTLPPGHLDVYEEPPVEGGEEE